jgi:hypothetical protein
MPSPHPPRALFAPTMPADIAELGQETGWEMWNQAVEKRDAQFVETSPMTALAPPGGGDRRYAATAPMGLPAAKDGAPPAKPMRTTTFEQVLGEARKANRVSPRPKRWAEGYALFPTWVPSGARLPPPPLGGDAWKRTPALAKRMAFRDHLEWAEDQRCLPEMHAWLQTLEEGDWYHMGD